MPRSIINLGRQILRTTLPDVANNPTNVLFSRLSPIKDPNVRIIGKSSFMTHLIRGAQMH